MRLSEKCSKNLDQLSGSIDRLIASYPSQVNHLHSFFHKHYERLKSQGSDTSTAYDLELLHHLSDVLISPDHSRESITRVVDSRPVNNSDWVVGQIEELLSKKGWSDRALINHIRNLVASKPENTVVLLDRTLELCTRLIDKLHGDLDSIASPLNENPNQLIYSQGLKL